ncbi:MAG: hypothetical protein AAFY65_12950 [Pseudomonadota bacterium]
MFSRKTEKADAPVPRDLTIEATVFFAEHLRFRTGDVAEALRKDFPAMGWPEKEDYAALADIPNSTDEMVLGALSMGGDVPRCTLIATDGGAPQISEDVLALNLANPDLIAAYGGSPGYLTLSISLEAADMVQRIDAARRLAAVVTVFAALPVATAVYWSNGLRFMAAADWVSFGEDALRDDKLPLLCMILPQSQQEAGPDGAPLTLAASVGLSLFCDYEIVMPMAPLDRPTALNLLMTVASMATELGHVFHDGDTIGGPDGPSETDGFRIRAQYADDDPERVIAMHFIHAKSPVDHEAQFGPLPKRPIRKRSSDMGWLKRRLVGRRAVPQPGHTPH